MNFSMIDRILWGVGAAGQIVLLFVLFSRKLSRPFPWFTGLIAFCVGRTTLLFLLRSSSSRYFYAYWSLAAIDVAIELCVLGEVGSKIFRPTGEISRDIQRPLFLLGAGSVMAAALVAWLADPQTTVTLGAVILRANLFASVLLSLLFVGLLAISVKSGFSWNTQVGVIARGLGGYAIFSILYKALLGHYGMSLGETFYDDLSRIHTAGYLVCLGYWTVSLLRRVPVSQVLPKEIEHHLIRLNAYASGLLTHLDARNGSS